MLRSHNFKIVVHVLIIDISDVRNIDRIIKNSGNSLLLDIERYLTILYFIFGLIIVAIMVTQ